MNYLESLHLLFVQESLDKLADDIVMLSLQSYCWHPPRSKYLQYKRSGTANKHEPAGVDGMCERTLSCLLINPCFFQKPSVDMYLQRKP